MKPPVVIGLAPPETSPKTYNPEQYGDQADLIAQRWMAWSAVALLIVTTIGVILVGITVWQTRSVLFEARRTADAASDTLAATRTIGDRQLRPYILYDSADNTYWTAEDGRQSGSVDISFRNCGQNPGIITNRMATVSGPKKGGGWHWIGDQFSRGRVILGPGQTTKFRFSTTSADDKGRFSWYEIGVLISYHDQYGTTYEDHVWLTFDLREFRQDYMAAGERKFRRPEDWPEQPKD
ncbi:DUF2160 domain-containing protein [Hyphomonas sp. CACIAM 19H1]|uniref:DUF2160 domain-containing protein n=1 Tax=Hyphomonas sp. CACIAM 19H1 TaxID=1873716 RepID=UPI0013B06240|nr:DUF2160 domain-containing protein [Hyphomonas sp. CACIAM 19H1]